MLRKLLKLLLLIIIIVVAVAFPAIVTAIFNWVATVIPALAPFAASIGATLAAMPWWVGAVFSVGAAYLVAPGATRELVQDAGQLAGTVAETAGGVVGKALTSVARNLWPIALGVLAFYFIATRKKEDTDEPATARS